MRTLKGRFLKTNILMLLISTALILTVAVLLILVVSVSEPEGFQQMVEALKDLSFWQKDSDSEVWGYAVMITAVALTVLVFASIIFSARLATAILQPLKQLRQAAENIKSGNLDFEIMSCEDEELDDLCKAFEEIRKKLKENAEKEILANEERNMLMANLSHDLRTPITTIKGYLEGIKDGIANTAEKQEKYLDTIYSKTLVLQRLVDNMSEYSELELGRMHYSFEFIAINGLLRELAEMYVQEIKERGLEAKLDIAEEELMIVGDREKLKRVFDNLISNAMKYNKEGGCISISLAQERNGAMILIADTGQGIKEKDINNVFDGFFRGDAARSNIKGNGLGLGISKQIIENHRGKIWIKSQENVGTEVYVFFPLRKKEQ